MALALPLSLEVILTELQTTERIISKWRADIENERIPGIQQLVEPGTAEERLSEYLLEMTGELALAGSKLATLADVLANPPTSG